MPRYSARLALILYFPNLIKVNQAETSQAGNDKYENHVLGEIFCYRTQYPDMDDTSGQVHDPLYPYKTTDNPDTLYPHEAMKTHDWTKFRITMQKEIDGRMNGKNYSVIHKSQVPNTAIVLLSLWHLKEKIDIKSVIIRNYKAYLNIYGS